MDGQLRILLVEDLQTDAELIMAELRRSGIRPLCTSVSSEPDFRAQLEKDWDVILADFSLPQFDALKALEIMQERADATPLIVITGSVGEEVAVNCIKRGAADYLLKDRLARLGSAIHQALAQKKDREASLLAYRAMRESEQRFRALIENSSDGLLLLNQDAQVIRCYRDLFGGDGGTAVANFFEWMIPEDRPLAEEAWSRIKQGTQLIEFRVEAGGETRRVEAVFNDLSETPGVRAVAVHYRDITVRRQLEEQLRHSQKMEAVGQLAAGLGHDFNNLLTIISGYSRVLSQQSGLSEISRNGLQEIETACRRATRLTQQLLAFSRKRARHPQILDVNDAVSGLAGLLDTLLGVDVQLNVDLDPSLDMVKADPGEIEQLVMNLVTNARDAMAGRGVLTIATRNLPATPGSEAAERRIELSVTDTGCGLSQEVLDRIFEPFYTTKDVGKGTGLGLSIVYGIVTNAGGQVLVESEIGEGTTFRVILPSIVQTPAPGARRPALTEGGADHGATILLVEDDEAIRRLIVSILEPLGYTIVQARNGLEALETYHAHSGRIDLLLTDVRMPEISGIEMASQIREANPELKTLFISGYTETEPCGPSGSGCAFLPKPFPPDMLVSSVRALLGTQPRKPSILVVDDDAQIRNLLTAVLQNEGYLVDQAEDGTQALRAIQTRPADLVITDLVMPDREGIETIKNIREAAPELKIIAISGNREGIYLRAAELMGADATFGKPLELDAMVKVVRNLLGDKQEPRRPGVTGGG